jgi:TolA-binding protein
MAKATTKTAVQEAKPGRMVRLWNAARQVPGWVINNSLLVGGIATAAVFPCIAVGYLVWSLWPETIPEQPPTLKRGLEALDRGAYREARQLANELASKKSMRSSLAGGPAFILGAIASHEADNTLGHAKAAAYLLAARQLQEAQALGFPDERRSDGLFLLGRALVRGRQLKEGAVALETALLEMPGEGPSDRRTAIYRLLVQAYRDDGRQRQALAPLDLYLADAGLTAREREWAHLEKARIQLELADLASCALSLDQIPAASSRHPDAIIVRAGMLLREAQAIRQADAENEAGSIPLAAKQRLESALDLLAGIKPVVKHHTRPLAQASYLSGLCHAELGNLPAALEAFRGVRRSYPDSAESFAAGFMEAELISQHLPEQSPLPSYVRAMSEAGDPAYFNNPWIKLEDLRRRTLVAYQQILERGQFEDAAKLSAAMAAVFPAPQQAQLVAELHRDWGLSIAASAEKAPLVEREPLLLAGREKMRLAAKSYATLAQLRILTRDYPDDVWASAECYLAGHDFVLATSALREYLKNEVRRRRPMALVNLGEALLAQGDLVGAIAALRECIEFYPQDSASFRARLLSSRCHVEQGDAKTAVELLQQNLEGDYLTPESREWRDSLFALGKLLYADARYPEAIERLEEAVERYPDVKQAIEADYLVAESYRRRALPPRQVAATNEQPAPPAAPSAEIRGLREAAIARYDQVIARLSASGKPDALLTEQTSLLRSAHFMRAGVLMDLGRLEEAAQALAANGNRYQQSPEALEAYVQLSDCYRRLDKPADSTRAIKRAQAVLKRLPEDARFDEVTNYTRQQWLDRLEWLSKL